MPPPVTDEAQQLRQRARRRLIGASVLALLLVVFVPMLLDRETQFRAPHLDVTIPAHGDGPATPATGAARIGAPVVGTAAAPTPPGEANSNGARVPETADTPPVAAPSPREPKAEAGTTPAPAAPAPVPAVVQPLEKSESHAAKVESTAPVPNSKKELYVVQVGVFSDAGKAKQLQARLAEQHIKSYSEPLPSESGLKTRVRVGPFASRAEAEKLHERLALLGENAMVVRQ